MGISFWNPSQYNPQDLYGTLRDSGSAYDNAIRVGASNAYDNAIKVGAGANPGKVQEPEHTGAVKNPGESTVKAAGRKSSPAECETCKERKYQDGSDEMVSFKSAAHISPEASASRVRAHEQEHVSNAYKKAAENNGKVLSCSVSLHTAICPECGRSYVSGGVTRTQIAYSNEDNPYQKMRKATDAGRLAGLNYDVTT